LFEFVFGVTLLLSTARLLPDRRRPAALDLRHCLPRQLERMASRMVLINESLINSIVLQRGLRRTISLREPKAKAGCPWRGSQRRECAPESLM
jgi:hypothetical protein